VIIYLLLEMLQRKAHHDFICVFAFSKNLLDIEKFELTKPRASHM